MAPGAIDPLQEAKMPEVAKLQLDLLLLALRIAALLSAGLAASGPTWRPSAASRVVLAIAAEGFTVASIETYKTFFFPNKPRGKFAGQRVQRAVLAEEVLTLHRDYFRLGSPIDRRLYELARFVGEKGL